MMFSIVVFFLLLHLKNKKTALILSRGTNPAAGDSYGTKFLANLIVFEENPQLNHAFIHLSFHAFVLWLQ